MSERKIKDAGRIDLPSFYDLLDGKTPEQVIEVLRKMQQEYSGRDVFFKLEHYGYDGGITFELHERRLETDEEMAQRLKLEASRKRDEAAKLKKKHEQELKEYKRLKKKFETA